MCTIGQVDMAKNVYGLYIFPTLLFSGVVQAATLAPDALAAFQQYTDTATAKMKQRAAPGKIFLWADESPERMSKLRAGEVVVSPADHHNPKKVPSGLIHDWLGAIFIPHATLKDVMRVVNDYAHYKEWYPPAVTDSKLISTSPSGDRFSMRVVNKSFLLSTALDADYESRYVQVDDHRGYSVSRMTRIQEIENYGSSAQHILPQGEGTGMLWRLFSINRYEERDGGVYLEREAIGLSRDVPASVRWLADPIIRRVSRSSLSTSLQQTEAAVNGER